jgi:hypothetical protein
VPLELWPAAKVEPCSYSKQESSVRG